MSHGVRQKIRSSRPATFALLSVAAVALIVGSDATAWSATQRKLTDIAITPLTVSLIPGGTQAFQATGIYNDHTTEDLTSQVVWKSRDTRVAVIDATGLATALSDGHSDISASLPAARVQSKKNARLEVPELDEIAVDPASVGVRVGGEVVLKALGTYEDGTSGIDLTDSVEWTSKKPKVVKIGTNEAGQIIAIGVGAGSTNVEARDPDSGTRSDSTTGKITVVGKLVSITVTPDLRVIRIGERVKYKATGTFEKGVTADISNDVEWGTGDAAVATADELGRVTGVGVGSTAVIATDVLTGIASTASDGDGVAQVVSDLTSLQVKPNPVSLNVGAKTPMKASARFEGVANSVNVTTKVDWHASDPSIVDVNRNGVATCLALGSAIVSASDPLTGLTSTDTGGDALVRCGIAVVGVQISPATLRMRVGKNKKVKAYLVYEDDSRDDITKRVTWASSNVFLVTVDREEPNIGRVNAQASGEATVTASDPVTGLSSTGPGGVSLVVTVP